jgi:hypothetical protein
MLGERQRQEGSVVVEVRKADAVIRRVAARNQIVSGGRALVANLFRGQEKRGVTHLALGSGSRPVSSSDTGLEAELSPRRPFDSSQLTEESASSAMLRSVDGKPSLRVTSLAAGAAGDSIKIRVAREGRKTGLWVESPSGREEFAGLKIDEISKIESRLVRLEALSDEPPAETAGPVALAGGQDLSTLLSATFGYDECNGRITEAGLFTAASGGVMYNRVVFPEIQKTRSLSLTISWKITF